MFSGKTIINQYFLPRNPSEPLKPQTPALQALLLKRKITFI